MHTVHSVKHGKVTFAKSHCDVNLKKKDRERGREITIDRHTLGSNQNSNVFQVEFKIDVKKWKSKPYFGNKL